MRALLEAWPQLATRFGLDLLEVAARDLVASDERYFEIRLLVCLRSGHPRPGYGLSPWLLVGEVLGDERGLRLRALIAHWIDRIERAIAGEFTAAPSTIGERQIFYAMRPDTRRGRTRYDQMPLRGWLFCNERRWWDWLVQEDYMTVARRQELIAAEESRWQEICARRPD